MFTMALDFQLVPSKIAQIKSSQVKSILLFLFWCMEIHQSKHKQKRVALNLAEVDCLRQASIKVFIIQQIPKLSKEQSMQWVDYLSLCKTKSNYVCRKHWRQNTNRFFKRRRLRLSGGGIRGNTFRAKLYLIAYIFTPADFLRKRCVIKLMEIALDFLASFASKPI